MRVDRRPGWARTGSIGWGVGREVHSAWNVAVDLVRGGIRPHRFHSSEECTAIENGCASGQDDPRPAEWTLISLDVDVTKPSSHTECSGAFGDVRTRARGVLGQGNEGVHRIELSLVRNRHGTGDIEGSSVSVP